ncbi:MAG: peptidyl-prolyl cis-trans isomerase [Candidatus Eisenbacteria bacterium]|uniref:Peptidyl-prolyl cis-trans isomerase n=1 Tax=Eiseniibacteriota bacterium TaxID=2212470 RepID=A0A948RWV1_UNCEI|nr:peptidyl-prolyl cis-trans isomerase [Candidatus Eisenbacteria bacterium]MBU1949489.1 peptidyl-prolyl cis-trans isomerase [Candidatus Eisenbacteria bacterium]MBU2689719.1 peptidyl-prolyl cis-trans isomerase [Candidatus Eisenbacteria bacterium]
MSFALGRTGRHIRGWILPLGILGSLISCGTPNPIVLEVGEEQVPLSVFEQAFWEFTAKDDCPFEADTSGAKAFLEIYKDKEIMEFLASQKIPVFDAGMQDRWEGFVEDAMTRLLDRQVIADAQTISPAELKDAYEKLKTQFHLREIRIRRLETAERILSMIGQGAIFGKVAAKESDDARAKAKEGDIGWVTLGQIAPPVYDAAAGLAVGEISGVIRSSLGFHLIQLEGRRETESVRSYEESVPTLERIIRQEKTAALLIAFHDELKERYKYQLHGDEIVWLTNWLREETAAAPRGAEAMADREAKGDFTLPVMAPEDQRRIVATMTGDTLTAILYLAEMTQYPSATWPTFDSPEDVINSLEGLAISRMRLAEARRLKLDKDPNVAWLAGKKRDAIHSRQFYLRYAWGPLEPDEEECRRYYDENPGLYNSPERRSFLAYHVKDRQLAEEIGAWLRAGDAPEEIWTRARERDSTAAWTTLSGTRFYSKGESRDLDEVLFLLGKDEVSDPIPFSGGYTIARILKVEDPKLIPFDDMKQKLKNELWRDKADKYLDVLIAAARDSLPIVVHEGALSKVRLAPPEGWLFPRQVIFGDVQAPADSDM